MRAAAVLAGGGLVALPTETVYGLGADATSGAAVASIYALKQRPQFNPLIAHVASLAAAQHEGVFNADALALAQAFWPGPLTLVVPVALKGSVSDLARAGLDSIGLRVPAHPAALAILEAFGKPVAAPSANRSGRISPTTADHVARDLGSGVGLIVDGGPCEIGVESTIVACLDGPPVILRPGGVSRADIERVLGKQIGEPAAEQAENAVLAPGMLPSHYAPRAKVRMNAVAVKPGEAVLDFHGRIGDDDDNAIAYLDLSSGGSLMEAAANLFAFLHRLDASGATTIAVAPVPQEGLGEAINDRLTRAAAPREG
ncbi:L-threonylcarbamoyladenylate synthase [Terripilifer ovatus]|uniref:L-threonylcarbamoyladenylate synthase n=1 Tax=Terripilifer ovatus TaxID=3032367 RepID=UPI003AB9963E